MKIGLVCPYAINKNGGVQEVVIALKENLQARGHDVKIITPQPRDHKQAAPKDVIFAGTSVDFRSLSFSNTTSQVSSTADVERIDAMLAEEQFDVLNFHEPWMPLLSRQLLQRSTCLNVGTFHSKVTEAMLSRSILKVVYPYLKSVLNYIDVITAVSPAAADYVVGLTDREINYIPNGIDLSKYYRHEYDASKVKPNILYVGRLERRKGATYLIQAFHQFSAKHPEVVLNIVGDGPDREKLELLCEDLKLKNVKFWGFVSEKKKIELLSKASIFCSPALFGESFGIVLLEAMATGAICVAGNNPGYSDLMKGLGAVSIIDPSDGPEFARRLELLMYEPELRDLWQKWAANYIKAFDYSKVVDQYEKIYIDSLKNYDKTKKETSVFRFRSKKEGSDFDI